MTAIEFLKNEFNNPEYKDDNGLSWYETIEDLLQDINHISSEVISHGRHFDNTFDVVKIGGVLIGFDWAASNRSKSKFDLGFELNEESICYVEQYTETVTLTKYRKLSN